MPDNKVSKFVKRWRNKRNQRRLQKAGDELVRILEGKNPRDLITFFSKRDKMTLFSKLEAFGTIVCPLCGNVKAYVSNPAGVSGDPDHDYMMAHTKFHDSYDCKASGLLLKNLFK